MEKLLKEEFKKIEDQGLILDDIVSEYEESYGGNTLMLTAVVEIELPCDDDGSQGLWRGGVRLYGYEKNFKPEDTMEALEVLAWGLDDPTETGAETESPFQGADLDDEETTIDFINDGTYNVADMAIENVQALKDHAARIIRAALKN